jgi:hypothetical protein
MAVVARKRDSRRVPYEKLRERLWESRLPWDDAAERAAIGAVLIAPNDWARRMVRRAYSGHFYDRAHGWLWNELSSVLCRKSNDANDPVSVWIQRADLSPRFRREFCGSVSLEIAACLRDCFWWHGNYFIDKVLAAAKLRASVIQSAEQLGKSLENAERWWMEQ